MKSLRILKIDPLNINIDLIKEASIVINNRGLVAFPTETVYGLGANALDPKAVSGIFEAKRRPLDDPLIVHISNESELDMLAREVPRNAKRLIERFWPGPLTVVLKKTDLVPDLVTTGLGTVAVRMPSNPIAKKLIETAGIPLAAPSANLFGKPSPTKAQHVANDLDGRIDMILDGGETDIGVESTVIEFAEDAIYILRPGGVSTEEIKLLVGDMPVLDGAIEPENSPGKYLQHYSPYAEVILVERGPHQVDEVKNIIQKKQEEKLDIGVMSTREHETEYKGVITKVLGPSDDGKTCASRLFHLLREFDDQKVDVIIAEGILEEGLGRAVMNRIRKAAGPCLKRNI